MSRFHFPLDPTAAPDRDDVRLAAELQAIAQDDTRRPTAPASPSLRQQSRQRAWLHPLTSLRARKAH